MATDVGLCAQMACIWEVTARKPGNVHRYRDFEDVSYLDFILSAAAIAPVLTTACQRRVGETILDSVRATRRVSTTNTNLGIILLLAPLASVPPEKELQSGIASVLAGLDVTDARLTYEAIRLANPGGLGAASDQDVADEPTLPLCEIMKLAAPRDMVARQYADGYREVFNDCVPALGESLKQMGSIEGAIIRTQLQFMSLHADTLIARKCGIAVAAEAGERAAGVLAAGWPEGTAGRRELAEFDAWLRGDGHRRNPGATADIITAGLFVLLRDGALSLPTATPWALSDATTD